jgi:hypothetical protein
VVVAKENVFSNEDYKLLCDTVDAQYSDKPKDYVHISDLLKSGWENKLKIERDVGKATLELRPLPKSILDAVIQEAKELGYNIVEDQIVAIYQRYSTEYGVPSLAPHIDFKAGGISMDYLLRKNVDWPVVVEDVSYNLKVNEAIFFDASAVVHWRPRMELKPDESVEIVLFHLLVPNDVVLSQQEKDERVKPYLDGYLT